MKTRAALLVTLAILGVVSIAFVLHRDESRTRSEGGDPRLPDRPDSGEKFRTEPVQVETTLAPEPLTEEELAAERAATTAPPPAMSAPPAPGAPPPASESPGERRARIDRVVREYLDALKVPPSVAREAADLHVGPESIRAMYAAEYLLAMGEKEAALATLAAYQDEGFRAVMANVRGNPTNYAPVRLLVTATWRPGLEASLLEWLRAASPRENLGAPLRALGAIDTPEVREFLRGALKVYDQNASNFAMAASSLAQLKDDAAVQPISVKLRESWWSGLHGSLLDSLGEIGSREARQALLEFVRDEKAGSKAAALSALARIDPTAARAEAKALLGPESKVRLLPDDAAAVRAFLDR